MGETTKNIPENRSKKQPSPSWKDVSWRPQNLWPTVLAGAGAGLIISGAAALFRLPFFPVWILASLATSLSIGAVTTLQGKKYEKYLSHIEQENHRLELLRQKSLTDSAEQTEFLADMARELRTPASVIISLARVSLRQDPPEALAVRLEDIVSSGRDVLETANDILDLSRIELGQMAFTETRYSLSSLLSDFRENLNPRLEGTDISFAQEVDGSIPNLLWGDGMRLAQILSHMADSVLGDAKAGTLDLSIRWKKQGDTALLTIGLSLSHPHGSLESTGREVPLPDLKPLLAEKLAEHMGGSILSEKKEKGRRALSAAVPQKILQESPTYREAGARPRNALPKADNRHSSLTFPGARVLVIDDSAASLRLLKGLLAPYNVKGEYVLCAPECLERNWAKSYDLIFLDVFLQELSGGELLRYLRKNPRFQTPVVALGTPPQLEAVESLESLGFTGFLAKPIQPEELERCLGQHLSAFLPTEKKGGHSEKIVFTLPPQDRSRPPVKPGQSQPFSGEPAKPVPKPISQSISHGTPTDAREDVDKDVLDISLGIQNTAGEESFYVEILELYLSEAQEKKNLLRSYLDAGDMGNYAVQVHAMKSTMRSLGAMKAGELAFDLETHSKKDDLDYVRDHHENMIKETELAEEQIRRYLSRQNTPG